MFPLTEAAYIWFTRRIRGAAKHKISGLLENDRHHLEKRTIAKTRHIDSILTYKKPVAVLST